MNYETICKYVFEKEKVDWELHASKKRDTPLVQARQIATYLGNWFYPKLSWSSIGAVFEKDHATAMHSVKHVKNLMATETDFRLRVYDYIDYVHKNIKKEEEEEIMKILNLKDENVIKSLLSVIDKMALVAEVYCSMTNKKIIKNEN